ncbi:MAG TPA: hypothetical protein VMG80_04430, partial [Solirubrobacteraceae bacterium]|nr:hypothetical protein [Solirubrobacteraceae bacterium]
MRPPIKCIYGNCVFADGLDDGWAAFRVGTRSYQWLSEEAKRGRLLELLGAIEAVEADLQIVRVARRWRLDRYVREQALAGEGAQAQAEREQAVAGEGAQAQADVGTSSRARAGSNEHGHTRVRAAYLDEHGDRLEGVGEAEPAVFLFVSLRDPERDVGAYVSQVAEGGPREWLGRLV